MINKRITFRFFPNMQGGTLVFHTEKSLESRSVWGIIEIDPHGIHIFKNEGGQDRFQKGILKEKINLDGWDFKLLEGAEDE